MSKFEYLYFLIKNVRYVDPDEDGYRSLLAKWKHVMKVMVKRSIEIGEKNQW